MGKWDDDIPLLPAGSVKPSTVSALLRKLGLATAPEDEKLAAIKGWLNENSPGETMLVSLTRAGYGDLAMDYRIAALGTLSSRRDNRRAAG